MAYSAPHAAVAAAKRQPIFLPGFDRDTQLDMEFDTAAFATAWLRRTFTNEDDPSILNRLALDEHAPRERRLAEVRYGNNITLLLKACYCLRDFHGHASFWTAVSQPFGSKAGVGESVASLFLEARDIYLSNHSATPSGVQLATEATHWADKWASFLREPRDPLPARDTLVFVAVKDFFQKEKANNGDLACVLSMGDGIAPPSATRAPRKRSPSPTALQGTPYTKRRALSNSTDEPAHHDSVTGRNRTQSLVAASRPSGHREQEPHETTIGQDGQSHRKTDEEFHFEWKIRGHAQNNSHGPSGYQDHPPSEANGYEALAKSNYELQERVAFLEKGRLEAARAQKDRDDAIRTLQVRFAALEKKSAVAEHQSSLNVRFIRELKLLGTKLSTQAEQLQRLEKHLVRSDQAAQRMQVTIASLQKNIALQARPTNEQARVTGAETETQGERAPATFEEDISEMRVKIMSLEAKSALFNDIHKTIRDMKTKIEAQKDKVADPISGPTNEEFNQDISTRLTAVKDDVGRQGHALREVNNIVTALKDQATVRDTRIACLETRPDMAAGVSQLESRVSTLQESHAGHTQATGLRFAEILEMIQGIQKNTTRLIETVENRVSELQARIATVEEHGTEISKRLDDMEVYQGAPTSHDQSSRIDEMSQSLESFQTKLLDLSSRDDVEFLRAEVGSLSQKDAFFSQAIGQCEDNLASVTSMVEGLSSRMKRLDEMYENYVAQRHRGPGQLLHSPGDIFQNEDQNDISAVMDSLCKRVSVMENGFQILGGVMSGPRR